jgi:tetratricopeptide (TPR) repeat protein
MMLKCCLMILFVVAWAAIPVIAYQEPGKVTPETRPSPPSPAAQQSQPQAQPQETPKSAHLRYLEAQRLKGQAQRLRSSRYFDEAIKAFKDTIQLDPLSAEPHVDLGELYFFYLSRRDLAEQEGLEAIRLDPKNIGGHLLLARLYITQARTEKDSRTPNIDKAIRQYEKVAELDPSMAESWALLAELYQMKNDDDRQITALEKWALAPLPNDTFFYRWLMNDELSPDQAYYQLSQIYLSKRKNQKAIEAARLAYESNPDSNAYARNLISVLRNAGTSEDELRVYAQLVKSFFNPAVLIGYGSALVRAGQYPEAVRRLREYVKLDPSNASAIGLLALAQRRANERLGAIETLKTALANVESSTRIDLVIELAQTYEELGRNEEAIAHYEQAFESFLGKGALTPVNMPLFNEVVSRLVRACRRVGNQSKLQSVLARTRRVIDEQNPMLDLIAIESLREDGKRREALQLAQAASRRRREDRALKLTEALILNDLKRSEESLELLREMLKGTPEDATDDASVYMIMSSVQMQSGDLKSAEGSARKAIELNPDDNDALVQLSSVLDRAERYGESEKILRDLIKRNPANATALNNLGYFLVERGERYDEALKLIERAVNIEPTNGNFLDSLGWAHYKKGNLEEARVQLEKAMIHSRRNATIHEHLGDVLRDQGRESEARRQWEKALEYSIAADEITRIKVKLKDTR